MTIGHHIEELRTAFDASERRALWPSLQSSLLVRRAAWMRSRRSDGGDLSLPIHRAIEDYNICSSAVYAVSQHRDPFTLIALRLAT